jgi:hypothetical protein
LTEKLRLKSEASYYGGRTRLISSLGSEEVLVLFSLDGLGELGLVLVQLHKLSKIELGLLEDLDFSDEDVLKREDLCAVFGDLLGDLVGQQLLEEVLKRALGALRDHDLHHLLAELLLVRSLGVAGSLDLLAVAAGEGDGEHANEVAVLSASLDEGLDQSVPLLDERAELVTSNVHTVEVGVAIEALDFLDLKLDLSPGKLMLIVVEFTKRDSEHTAAKGVSSDLCKRC